MAKTLVTNQHVQLTNEPRADNLTNRCLTADVREKGFYLKAWRAEVELDVDYKGVHDVSMHTLDNAFEIDIHLASKPSSNIFTYDVISNNLDFFYQPALTAKEISDGCIRPENVVGSYAVYHKTGRNNRKYNNGDEVNYMVGKLCHIYRPEAIDANNNKVWCDLDIDEENGTLAITVPQSFLDTAVYPVVIDPNFGYETQGTSNYPVGGHDVRHAQYTMGAIGGTSTSISYAGTQDGSVTDYGLAIYDDDASDNPNNLIDQAIAEGTTVPWYNGWSSLNTNGATLTASTIYWLSVFSDLTSTFFAYDTATYNSSGHFNDAWPPNDPANEGWNEWTDRHFSIYCTYTVSGVTINVRTSLPIDSGEHIVSKLDLPIDNKAGLLIKYTLPIDTGLMLSPLRTALPIEYAEYISNKFGLPIDSLGALQLKTGLPVETGQELSVYHALSIDSGLIQSHIHGIPIENGIAYVIQTTLPIESLYGVQLASSIPIEYGTLMDIAHTLPIEYGRIEIPYIMDLPIETRYGMIFKSSLPVEYTGSLQFNILGGLPIEFGQSLQSRSSVNIDTGKNLALQHNLPLDSGQGLSLYTALPVEYTGGITLNVLSGLPIEWKSTMQQRHSMPLETLMHRTVKHNLHVDSGISFSIQSGMPAEYGVLVSMVHDILAEWVSGLQVKTSLQVEYKGYLTWQLTTNIDFGQGIVVRNSVPLNTLIDLHVKHGIPLEWLSLGVAITSVLATNIAMQVPHIKSPVMITMQNFIKNVTMTFPIDK